MGLFNHSVMWYASKCAQRKQSTNAELVVSGVSSHALSYMRPTGIVRLCCRYYVPTSLSPPHESIPFKLLVSLPATYPTSSSPQLQLLSRYIGPFQVDSGLFGSVLKTYIASGRVEFVPGQVAIFDGIENVREVVMRWYEDRLSRDAAAELRREDEKHLHTEDLRPDIPFDGPDAPEMAEEFRPNAPVDLPEGVQIWVSEPIVDRKSTFIGRACQITHPSQVKQILDYLMQDKSISRATHPIINAWRCEVNGVLHQGTSIPSPIPFLVLLLELC